MTRRFLFLILGMCCPAVACADWIADVDAGVFHDSNLSNSELDQDIKSDSALTASLSAGQFIQLDSDHSLAITADFRGELYDRFSGINNLAAGATVSLRRKLGLGAAAPWLRVSASAARLEFNDDLRDGWRYRAGLAAGKRFAERWEVEAGYSFEKRTGDNPRPTGGALPGDVFDLRSQSFSLDVRFSPSEKTLIFAGYILRDGDVVSTGIFTPKIRAASTAVARDPVFGPNALAYKLDAISHVATVGVSQAMSPRSSLNLSYQRQITHGDGDNNYYKNIFTGSFSYSF